MNQSPDYDDSLKAIAEGIEAELKRLGLWDSDEPDQAALASEQPFCYDTLLFHQWLQWVFLPKVRGIAEDGDDLPESSQILPYAEECLGQHGRDEDQLLFLIRSFDEIVFLTIKGGSIAPDD